MATRLVRGATNPWEWQTGRFAVRVALFITCFNDTLFPDAGKAAVALLRRLGCEVDFPLEQTCCGQMHGNSGYEDDARPLAARFQRVFGDAEAVVSPSGRAIPPWSPRSRRLGRRPTSCRSSSSTCSG